MDKYEELAECILDGGRLRSEPYRQGLIRILRVRHRKELSGTPTPPNSSILYEVGTVEADAYFSGCERGHFEWSNNKDEHMQFLRGMS